MNKTKMLELVRERPGSQIFILKSDDDLAVARIIQIEKSYPTTTIVVLNDWAEYREDFEKQLASRAPEGCDAYELVGDPYMSGPNHKAIVVNFHKILDR